MSNFIPVLFILCIGLLTTKTRAHQSSIKPVLGFNRFEKTWSYPRFMGQFLFGTRKAEVLNSLIINTTAKANDTTDILQQDVSCIVCFGRSIYYKFLFGSGQNFYRRLFIKTLFSYQDE